MSVIEIKVPDIGDFTDVPVIEILVQPGDTVAPEDPLVTLESDKATMEVPAPAAGKVVEIMVSLGDTVSEGSAILKLESSDAAVAEPVRRGTCGRRTRNRSTCCFLPPPKLPIQGPIKPSVPVFRRRSTSAMSMPVRRSE